MFETIDLGSMPWRSQMMLLAGIAMLIWVMLRRTIRSRRDRRREDIDFRSEQKRWSARDHSGAPLANAPVDVARWQSGMFDLQRELRAELETKIAVVQSMVRLADQRIAMLTQLNGTRLEATLADRAQRVRELTQAGKSNGEISEQLRMSVGDIEFLQSIG